MYMRNIIALLVLVIGIANSEILRLRQCNKYDAEFSKIKYNHRLVGATITELGLLSLRKCLTRCMYHTTCHSVNYMRSNERCELVGDSAEQNSTRMTTFEQRQGWNHIETNFYRKTIGEWCMANDPCPAIKQCRDICDGTHECADFFNAGSLIPFIQDASQSSTLTHYIAMKAFDGNELTFSHTSSGNLPPWIRVTFTQRVFIYFIEFVNRLPTNQNWGNRNDHTDLKTILYEGTQSIETFTIFKGIPE
ncbi:uncharacterized protein [Clytia hemisphaerica]|uniref:uncharacterized protein isoform X2 n=1 Tax=Clytia hemisphaerica TaxID=252671 RepID=UPI0034D55277